MHKTISVMLTGACIFLALTGCGQTKQQHEAAPGKEPVTAEKPADSATSQPEEIAAKVKAYYGDENGQQLVEKEVTVNYKQAEDKYRAALQTLTASSDSKLVPLCKGFTFNTVTFSQHMLTVDVTISQEARQGAPGEMLVLEALKRTLFQFPEIDAIDILVDGKQVDSMMGHVELPHPIKRS